MRWEFQVQVSLLWNMCVRLVYISHKIWQKIRIAATGRTFFKKFIRQEWERRRKELKATTAVAVASERIFWSKTLINYCAKTSHDSQTPSPASTHDVSIVCAACASSVQSVLCHSHLSRLLLPLTLLTLLSSTHINSSITSVLFNPLLSLSLTLNLKESQNFLLFFFLFRKSSALMVALCTSWFLLLTAAYWS